MSQDSASSAHRRSPGLWVVIGIVLLPAVVIPLWVPLYDKTDPALWGFPFFFWYQFLWVFITSALTYTAHRLVLAARGQRDSDDDDRAAPPDGPVGDDDPLNPTPGFRS
jgi:hypothetical protein